MLMTMANDNIGRNDERFPDCLNLGQQASAFSRTLRAVIPTTTTTTPPSVVCTNSSTTAATSNTNPLNMLPFKWLINDQSQSSVPSRMNQNCGTNNEQALLQGCNLSGDAWVQLASQLANAAMRQAIVNRLSPSSSGNQINPSLESTAQSSDAFPPTLAPFLAQQRTRPIVFPNVPVSTASPSTSSTRLLPATIATAPSMSSSSNNSNTNGEGNASSSQTQLCPSAVKRPRVSSSASSGDDDQLYCASSSSSGAPRRFRRARIPLKPAQAEALERCFQQTAYLNSKDIYDLSTALKISERKVKVWYQNRRARQRRMTQKNAAAGKGGSTTDASSPVNHNVAGGGNTHQGTLASIIKPIATAAMTKGSEEQVAVEAGDGLRPKGFSRGVVDFEDDDDDDGGEDAGKNKSNPYFLSNFMRQTLSQQPPKKAECDSFKNSSDSRTQLSSSFSSSTAAASVSGGGHARIAEITD